MALQKQSFGAFTPVMFQAFVSKVKVDTGVTISADSGVVTHGGFQFSYSYNPAEQMLVLQCLKKPLFLSSTTVLNGLSEEVANIIISSVTPKTS